MAAPGLPGLMPVIVQENWVQCENPNCNKWRKVPPGYEAKEDEPWYCYLNPDDRKATCSASEEEYKEAIVISAPADAEEAEHNRFIRERLTAGLLASTSGGGKGGKGRGKGRGGRGRGRGRQSAAGRGSGGAAAEPKGVDYFAGRRVKPGAPKYREDSDDDLDFLSDEEPEAPASRELPARRQQPAYAQHFLRLMENQGSWEAAAGHTTAGGAAPCMPPPAEAWEGLSQHAPELAEQACSAADVASALLYFEGSGAAGVPDGGAADAVARLSAMLASAAALVDTEDSLTPAQRHSCGLDAASAGPAAAGAGLPFGVAAPLQQQQQQQHAASMGAAAGWQQQAAAFFPSPAPAPQPVSQQLGAGMSQQGMPAGLAGWPMQLTNGQQQQPAMQQAPSHHFAQLQPAAQQWQTPAQHGMQPFGMAMQQQQQQQLGGAPLMPGVSPELVAQYAAMLAQKPAAGPHANGGLAGMR
ncbi:hypothetical protein ABPG77_006805 [Micractinium sp. CCAP 211/92]